MSKNRYRIEKEEHNHAEYKCNDLKLPSFLAQLFVRMMRDPTPRRTMNAATGSATAVISITPRWFGINSPTANGASPKITGSTPSQVMSLKNQAE